MAEPPADATDSYIPVDFNGTTVAMVYGAWQTPERSIPYWELGLWESVVRPISTVDWSWGSIDGRNPSTVTLPAEYFGFPCGSSGPDPGGSDRPTSGVVWP